MLPAATMLGQLDETTASRNAAEVGITQCIRGPKRTK